MKILFSLFLMLSQVASAQTPVTGYDRELNMMAVRLLREVPKITARTNPMAPCESMRIKNTIAKKIQPDPTPPPLRAYRCVNEIQVYNDNDNLLFDMVGDGDDFGDTFSLGVIGSHQLSKNRKWTLNAESHLYTKEAEALKDEKLKAQNMVTQGQATQTQDVSHHRTPWDQPIYAIYFNDVTRVKGSFEKGKTFYYQLTGGYERRQTSVKRSLGPSSTVQTNWHKALKVYNFEYLPAAGQEGFVMVENETANYQPSYAANEDLQKISENSLLLGAAAGYRKTLGQGRCELEVEASGLISTEKHQVIGPNSYLKVTGASKLYLVKPKRKQLGVNVGINGGIIAFPDGIGETVGTSLEGVLPLGKKGGSVRPYVLFYLPMGQLPFQAMNDHDIIERFGLRFIF